MSVHRTEPSVGRSLDSQKWGGATGQTSVYVQHVPCRPELGRYSTPAPAFFQQAASEALGAINCLHSLGQSSALRTSFPSRKANSLRTAKVLSS